MKKSASRHRLTSKIKPTCAASLAHMPQIPAMWAASLDSLGSLRTLGALLCALPLLTLLPSQLQAAELNIQLEIPRLKVAEYHRPYVALWLEDEQRNVHNLAVWYDLNLKDAEGVKWLKDLRQWWRRSGRELSFPVDGMTSATRVPGRHQLSFNHHSPVLAKLPAGKYQLYIEAVREVGGREILQQQFNWPPQAAQQFQLAGKSELGSISLEIKP